MRAEVLQNDPQLRAQLRENQRILGDVQSEQPLPTQVGEPLRPRLGRLQRGPGARLVARLSPRQFSRAFLAETGQSPAKAVEQLRLEAARIMMEQGRHSGNVVAEETGFADRERMRRAFVRTFGLPPQALRRRARLETAAYHRS